MPSGALMQVVAHGAQDLYLSANPQVTFFKAAYRRHTNFASESLEQTFNGTSDFGRKVTVELQRAGDLVTKMYVRAELPEVTASTGEWGWVSRVGHALLQGIELDVGGVRIDRQYGDWLNIWYELARNFAHDRGYDEMIGNTSALTTLSDTHAAATLWIPLQFACCRNDGLALPVIALQYHEIRINIEFRPLSQLVNKTANVPASTFSNVHLGNVSLFVDYIYLDNDERKRFAQASHEYLFEQLQFTGDESVTNANAKYRLNLNHPVKNLVWVARHNKYTSGNKFFAVPTSGQNPTDARLLATKRLVLRLATYTAGPALAAGAAVADPEVASGTFTNTSSESLTDIFAAIDGHIIIADVIDVDNVVIMGRMLSLEEFSTTVDVLLAGVDQSVAGLTSSEHSADLVAKADTDVCVYQWDNYGIWLDGSGNPVLQALLQLNGHDRFSRREGMYFNYVQPWQCHSNTPADGINAYSFALTPEDHQPSGSANFSRIDNATLNLDFHTSFKNSNSVVAIYAVNINVFRVLSGMGGLAYSN